VIAKAARENSGPRPNVTFMVDTPKRSVGETITQLLIGAVIILRQYVESHNTSHSIANEPTFTFTCCAGFNPAVVYHPGVSRGTG
jgi:hypothetical protein